jgi:hypothetical protein
MRSAVATALICALVTPALAAAQPDVAWWKVRSLPSGARMTVVRQGEPPQTVHLIVATDTGLVTLNVSDAAVPKAAAKGLIRIASEQPHLLMRVASDTSVRVDKQFVLTASGLFDGTAKVADYDRLIGSVSRTDVESGTVRLENVDVSHKMSRATKLAIIIAVAVPFLIYPIACLTQGCD